MHYKHTLPRVVQHQRADTPQHNKHTTHNDTQQCVGCLCHTLTKLRKTLKRMILTTTYAIEQIFFNIHVSTSKT